MIRRPFFSALGNAKLVFVVLFMCLIVSVVGNLFQGYRLSTVQDRFRIEEKDCFGKVNIINPNHIYPARVLNFTTDEWIELTSWPKSAKQDSISNIDKAIDRGVVTPNFVKQYKEMLAKLDEQGYLDDYVVSTIPLGASPETDVIKADGGWHVRQTFITRFYYSPEDNEKKLSDIKLSQQKDTRVEHVIEQRVTFFVVQYPNEAGFALDGLENSEVIKE